MTRSRPTAERGFALVEVPVALLILVVSMVGLLSLLASTVRSNLLAEQTTAAASVAQAKLEELQSLDYDTLASGSDTGSIDATGAAGGVYTRSWTVGGAGIAGAKQIVVTVTWQDRGVRQVELRTIVYDV